MPIGGAAPAWKLKLEQEEKKKAQQAARQLEVQAGRLHRTALHIFQMHSRPVDGGASRAGAWPWDGVRSAVLLDLKPREANRRQLLCLTTHDERAFVLKTCATDTLAQAHAERLTCTLAKRLRVECPMVHVVAGRAQLAPIVERVRGWHEGGAGVVVEPTSDGSLQLGLFAARQLAAPFAYLMGGARGKTLLEHSSAELRLLTASGIDGVLREAGKLAALDVLINNWDRWPLPHWQKNAAFFDMDEATLAKTLAPVRAAADAPVAAGSSDESAATQVLLSCGANLGNVLLHAPSAAVASIDTCVITPAAADYAERVAELLDDVLAAYAASGPSKTFKVTRAVLVAALHAPDDTPPQQLHAGFLRGCLDAATALSDAAVAELERSTVEAAEGGAEGGGGVPAPAAQAVRDACALVSTVAAVCRARQAHLEELVGVDGRDG